MAEERALKRQRSLTDENPEPNRPQSKLTPEQQLLLEKKRRQALERRLQRQATPSQGREPQPPEPSPEAALGQAAGQTLSEEQLSRIRQSREAALARKRAAAGIAAGTAEAGQAESAGEVEKAEQSQEAANEELPHPALRNTENDGPQDLFPGLSHDEKREEASQMQESCEGAGSDEEEEEPSSASSAPPWLEPSEPSDSASRASEASEGDESSTASSDSSSSSSSNSEESEDEEEQEEEGEEEEPEEEARDEVEPGGTEAAEQGEEDEMELEEASQPQPLPRCPGEARPKAEVPCCTERWPAVALQPIVLGAGEILASRTGRDRNAKQKLVGKLLCRWWYVLPDWPPVDFDFDAALAAQGYRRVPVESFELEPDVDEAGLRKAFTVSGGFRGLYRDQQGNLVDVRPVEGRPSYDRLMLRTTQELHQLVVLAYRRQLEELDSKPDLLASELEIRQQLRQELAQAQQGAKFSGWFRPDASSSA